LKRDSTSDIGRKTEAIRASTEVIRNGGKKALNNENGSEFAACDLVAEVYRRIVDIGR
jgi:hypothetical protein